MKTFLYLLVTLLCIALAICKVTEEEKEMVIGMSESCREAEGATKEDVESLADMILKENKEFKCLIACLHEQYGLVCA